MDSEFKKALDVFDDSIISQQLLDMFENPFGDNDCKPKLTSDDPYQERLIILLTELKDWVILKSQEMQEFEGEDLIRLHGEAVGCMYAIRELQRCFSSELQNT